MDTSDAALLALADQMSQQTGVDLATPMGEFMEANPGMLGAILRGEIPAPLLIPPSLVEDVNGVRKGPSPALGAGLLNVVCIGSKYFPISTNFKLLCGALADAATMVAFGALLLASFGASTVIGGASGRSGVGGGTNRHRDLHHQRGRLVARRL